MNRLYYHSTATIPGRADVISATQVNSVDNGLDSGSSQYQYVSGPEFHDVNGINICHVNARGNVNAHVFFDKQGGVSPPIC